jgi:hypothetical protein
MTESLGRPYIYVLFYTRYDPKRFRQEAKIDREALGFVHVKEFGKYHFAKNIHEGNIAGKVLYINVPSEVPKNAHVLERFTFLSGKDSLVAYTL